MKRAVTLVFAFFLAAAAFAQTPEEIISRMEAEMDSHENDGIIMTVVVKIPIVGKMTTKVYSLGDKTRIEAVLMGAQIITWSDAETEWEYNSKSNEIEITKAKASDSSNEGDAAMFSSVTDGYDVTLKKETADAWYFVCRKSKSNTDKDAPRTMDLAVAKGTYYPLSLSAKISGITMTMRDIAFGVTEKQVTFNPNDYPDATIIDKR